MFLSDPLSVPTKTKMQNLFTCEAFVQGYSVQTINITVSLSTLYVCTPGTLLYWSQQYSNNLQETGNKKELERERLEKGSRDTCIFYNDLGAL